ncbi:MAG: hypothetical protein K5663_03250 [Clostridiales bacterium]|nr:hypothetical protein [Clostridiales bacterium]
MKRTLSRLLALVPLALLLAALFCLTAQADPPDSQCPSPFSSDGHHTWHVRDYQKPTCTKRGYKLWVCVDCDDTYRETLPATGHEYEWKTTKAATCAKNGTRQQVCKVCGAKGDTATVKATGKHTWEWQTVKAATCGANGSRRQVCKVCKAKGKTETVKATGKHTWEWQSVKAATCGADGSRRQVCKVCGAKGKTEAVAATGKHSWGEWKDTKAALCETAGEQARSCSVCKQKETKTVPALGHVWDEGVMSKEPGYLNPGETVYTCARCGGTRTEETPARSLPSILRNSGPISTMSNPLPLMIMTQPEGGSILRGSGETLHMTVEAMGGEGEYKYEWRREYIGDSSWGGFITWFANKNHPLTADGNSCEANVGDFAYYCVVTDESGKSEESLKAPVRWKMYFDRQPENKNIHGSDSVLLSCSVKDGVPYDNGTYLYAWYKEDGSYVDLTDYGLLSVSEQGRYYCMVTDAGIDEGIVSDTVTVYDSEPLSVTELGDAAINEGETAELKAEASGGVPPYSYRWGTCENNDGYYHSFEALEGETSDTLYVPFSAQGYYAVEVSDAMNAAVRRFARVKEYKEPLVIVFKGIDSNIYSDRVARAVLAVAGGSEPLQYPVTFTLFKDGIKADSVQLDSETGQFTVTEAGMYALRAEDAAGRSVETDYQQVKDNRLKLTATEEACIYKLGEQVILEAKVEGGIGPFEYKWKKIDCSDAFEKEYAVYVTQEPRSSERMDRFAVTEPFTAWSLTVTDSRKVTATVSPIKVTYDGSLLLITKQPEGMHFEFDKDGDYYTVLECEAWSNKGHTLRYNWQKKYEDGWRYITWLSLPSGPELPTSRGGTYRCEVTDVTTGVKKLSNEVDLVMPDLSGSGYQVGKDTTIKLSVQGGKPPYTITCARQRHGFSDYYRFEYESFDVDSYIRTDAYGHNWAEYTLTGVSRHKKKWNYGEMEYWYRHYTYVFTVTDKNGKEIKIEVKMQSNQSETYSVSMDD